MRIFCSAKDSHIFSTKHDSVFVIFTFENCNEMLTNDVVNFEQLAPGLSLNGEKALKTGFLMMRLVSSSGYRSAGGSDS